MDKQQFFNGAVFDAWRWFGAHLGGGGAVFRTFAPNASRITLTGAMNGWTETDLHQDGRSGFWEVSVPGTQAGQLYKYRIYAADGSVTEHCDPYGFAMEMRPACCSIVTDLEEYRFTDDAWMQARSADPDAPLNIYEMHLGSWQRNPEDANGWFTYEQLADRLIPYLLDGGGVFETPPLILSSSCRSPSTRLTARGAIRTPAFSPLPRATAHRRSSGC